MDGAWLVRLRWRQRGAWLWPTFFVLTIVDGFILNALPAAGSSQTLVGGIIAGMVLNLLAVILLSRPLAALLRRRRKDLPSVVARNYSGTAVVVGVTGLIVTVGLIHHPTVVAQQRAFDDAVVRAIAFIGDRAPAQFRANAGNTNTDTIQAGSVYRTCVANRAGTSFYCVIVRPKMPLARSVIPDGGEPNSLFAAGTN